MSLPLVHLFWKKKKKIFFFIRVFDISRRRDINLWQFFITSWKLLALRFLQERWQNYSYICLDFLYILIYLCTIYLVLFCYIFKWYSFVLLFKCICVSCTAFPCLKVIRNAKSCFHLKSESVVVSSDNIKWSVLSISFFSK